MDIWEREEERLLRWLSSGLITQQEYNQQMRELQRDYVDTLRERAAQNYERDLENL